MLSAVILFILGLAFVIKGGDWFVEAAGWMAEATGIPKFIVGATIVSIATTTPELMVSVIAVIQGSNDLGIGNAIGSVSCNIGLGLALTMIFVPPVIEKRDFLIKGILMFVSALALFIFTWNGTLSIIESIPLLIILAAFVAVNLMSIRENDDKKEAKAIGKKAVAANIVKFVIGAAFVVFGAKLLVDNGTVLARAIGVPQSVIGLTLIAVGTSLPEIITAVASLIKRESAMSVGNVIGANIIDLTLILPVCSVISGSGLTVSRSTVIQDIPTAIILIVVTVVPTVIFGRFKRWQGVLAFAIYLGYIAAMVI